MGKNEQCNFSKGYDLDLKNFAAEQLAEKSTAVSPLQTEKKKETFRNLSMLIFMEPIITKQLFSS